MASPKWQTLVDQLSHDIHHLEQSHIHLKAQTCSQITAQLRELEQTQTTLQNQHRELQNHRPQSSPHHPHAEKIQAIQAWAQKLSLIAEQLEQHSCKQDQLSLCFDLVRAKLDLSHLTPELLQSPQGEHIFQQNHRILQTAQAKLSASYEQQEAHKLHLTNLYRQIEAEEHRRKAYHDKARPSASLGKSQYAYDQISRFMKGLLSSLKQNTQIKRSQAQANRSTEELNSQIIHAQESMPTNTPAPQIQKAKLEQLCHQSTDIEKLLNHLTAHRPKGHQAIIGQAAD